MYFKKNYGYGDNGVSGSGSGGSSPRSQGSDGSWHEGVPVASALCTISEFLREISESVRVTLRRSWSTLERLINLVYGHEIQWRECHCGGLTAYKPGRLMFIRYWCREDGNAYYEVWGHEKYWKTYACVFVVWAEIKRSTREPIEYTENTHT